VTHDQSEALTMSDRIAVFNAGRIEQIDTPQGIYDTPRTRFVAQFIGETNLVEASIAGIADEEATVALGSETTIRVNSGRSAEAGQKVSLSLRPERIRLGTEPRGGNTLPMKIADCVYHGDHIRVQLVGRDISLVARCERLAGHWTVGTPVVASFDPQDCTVLSQ
jgi:putative spermidine/putrescine transport system ATP-binding protein